MSYGRTLVAAASTALFALVACGDQGASPQGPPPLSSLDGGSEGGDDSPVPTGHCSAVAPHASPASPVEYGENELAQAVATAGSHATVCVTTAGTPEGQAALAASGAKLDARPESYAIVAAANGDTVVVGRDDTGALYGSLELAERLRLDGASATPPAATIAGAPLVPVRGATLYVVIEQASEASWWFRDPDFWTQYLDMLAHARMNFLDLRGMYNLANTIFPNSLLYFGSSASFPQVGAPQSDRDANVAMLGTIVQMAKARGIRVGFMTFRTDTSLTGDANDLGVPLTDPQLQVYTREATADVARKVPGLWRLGVRVGESLHDAAWFKSTFVAGMQQAATGAGFYVRTWLSTKAEIIDLTSAAGADPMIMAKYDGEHLAAPYVIAGGAFDEQNWAPSYSYEDYLNPPEPYSFVFEVRSGGTHRMFRFASYARIARAAQTFVMGAAKGFALEPPHAYFPQRDFYHATQDRYATWTFLRDELQYLMFGRLAYDPQTPVRAFRAALAARVGTDALWDAVQAASDVVPWIQAAHTCGPDQRDFAPDEEWGGPVAFWSQTTNAAQPPHACGRTDIQRIYQGPFDTFAVADAFDTAKDLASGHGTSRVTPLEVALTVLGDAKTARAANAAQIDPNNPWARDVVRECVALADLGDYFGHKLRGATALAVYADTASADYLTTAQNETQAADAAWTELANDTQYIAPFDDNMRVGPAYHWRNVLPWLGADAQSIAGVVSQVQASPPVFHGTLPAAATWLDTPRAAGPGLASLGISPQNASAQSWMVSVTFGAAVPAGATTLLWYKPFSAHTDWQSVALTGSGTQFQAIVPGTGGGAMFMAQVSDGPGAAWRYPDLLTETPYVVLAP
jgi:hypothetical protein